MADSGADKSVGVGRRKRKNQRKQQQSQRQEHSDGSKAKGSSSGTKKKQPRGGIQGSSASNDHTNDNAACNNVNELVNEDSTGTGSRSSNFKAEQAPGPGSGPGSGESEISQHNQPLKKKSDIGSWSDPLQTRPVAVESISSALDKPANETAVVTPKHYEDQQPPESMNELDSKLENLNLEHTTASRFTGESATGSAGGFGSWDSHSSTAGADTDPAVGRESVLDSWEDAPESVPESATDPAFNVPQAEAASSSLEKAENLTYIEKKGDLFRCPENESLAHCISSDVRMGRGIAVTFKKRFGGVPELLAQGQQTGGLAVLKRQDRYIYYLVTKENFYGKANLNTLSSSLTAMREHCLQHKVTRLSMPQIGRLDGLSWPKVVDRIHEIFKTTNMVITVYCWSG